MDKSIENIITNFDKEGNLLVAGKRNTIKTFPYNNIILNIKSFKIPTLYNGIIYRYFRKSKAKRSFEFATYLISKNIGTPKPIAFFENKNLIKLQDSYYVCEHITADYVFIDLFHLEWNENIIQILKEMAQFNFKIHEAGIEFKDNSPGNTLIKKNDNGFYDFFLIDLNRMKFHKKMSFNKRMKNMCRLTPSKDMVKVISLEYAKLYNKPENEVFELMWKYTESFFNKAARKKEIKKKLGL